MFKNKRITLKPYMKKLRPSKLSKVSAPLTLKISVVKIAAVRKNRLYML